MKFPFPSTKGIGKDYRLNGQFQGGIHYWSNGDLILATCSVWIYNTASFQGAMWPFPAQKEGHCLPAAELANSEDHPGSGPLAMTYASNMLVFTFVGNVFVIY